MILEWSLGDFRESPYCGKRAEAKYHSHQCISDYGLYSNTKKINGYQCLNRKDVSENFIRSIVNYDSFLSARKNFFQYFKANDTRNQVTGTLIICGDQKVDMDCTDLLLYSRIECKKEKTDTGGIFVSNWDVCTALDLLEDKGLPPPGVSFTYYIYSPTFQSGKSYVICMHFKFGN